MTRTIMRHSQGLQDPKLMHPEREWFIGLMVAVTIFIVTASGSAYSYVKNRHPMAEDTNMNEEVTVYRESIVKDALGLITARDEERTALIQQFTPAEILPEVAPEPVASTTPEAATTTLPSASSTEEEE